MSIARLTRTYLAVPAHRRRHVENAAASSADAVFLDLEDAVPPEEKAAALDAAINALTTLDWGKKTVAVRVNAFSASSFSVEVSRLAGLLRLDAMILPKAESTAEVCEAAGLIRAGAGRRDTSVELELLIETARGLVEVDRLAACESLVTALHLGVGDFAASIGARSVEIGMSPAGYTHVAQTADGFQETPLDLFAYPMMRLLVAARAFGLRAIDGPCGAFRDERVTHSAAVKAAAMGFDGKQVIHPLQIDPTCDAFVPGPDEVAYARKVALALEAARREGKAAATVDGKMVDLANARMIERVLHLAEP